MCIHIYTFIYIYIYEYISFLKPASKACDTYEWVMSHEWMGVPHASVTHVTHSNDSFNVSGGGWQKNKDADCKTYSHVSQDALIHPTRLIRDSCIHVTRLMYDSIIPVTRLIHDSTINVTRLICLYMWRDSLMPHSYMWHDWFVQFWDDRQKMGTSPLICVCAIHLFVWRDSLIHMPWIIHMCHDSLIHVPWLIDTYDMTHSDASNEQAEDGKNMSKRFTSINESWHIYEVVMSHIWMSHGTQLAEDGKKMSKRLKNYPDPEIVINAHGADALRMYLINSPVVRGEELRFREQVWLGSFTCVTWPLHVTWLLHVCDMTHSLVMWLLRMRGVPHSYVSCDLCTNQVPWCVWRRPVLLLAGVTWPIRMRDMTPLYVWYDSFTCVMWLIHMCGVTHLHVWHVFFTDQLL